MEDMLSRGASFIENPIRPLKRVEYEKLARDGFFDDEHVELLFGMVVAMPPPDPEHSESVWRVDELLRNQIRGRARVHSQNPFAATEDSEPQPDVFVVPLGDYWRSHPEHAYLIVEVSRSSLRQDRRAKALLYASSQVDEYWIVNHNDEVVEVYRDRRDNEWGSITVHRRGEVISPLKFPDVRVAVDDVLPPSGP